MPFLALSTFEAVCSPLPLAPLPGSGGRRVLRGHLFSGATVEGKTSFQAPSAFLHAFGIRSLTVRTVTVILCLLGTVISQKVLCSKFSNGREMTRPQGPLGAEQPQVQKFQALQRHQPDPVLQNTAGNHRRHPSSWPEAHRSPSAEHS